MTMDAMRDSDNLQLRLKIAKSVCQLFLVGRLELSAQQ